MKEARFTTGPFKASDFPLIVDDLVPPMKKMPVFIELHDIDASEQKPILINVDCIQTVEQCLVWLPSHLLRKARKRSRKRFRKRFHSCLHGFFIS
jgi:hypothetical protein